MYGYVLQDWITVRGSTTAPFVQNESEWIGFSSFQDIVFWVDIREVTTSGSLTLALQTAPTKDEVLFQTLTNCSLAITAPITPFNSSNVLPKTMLSAAPNIPLSTWVRWVLSNSAASLWDCTFRIVASANRVVQA